MFIYYLPAADGGLPQEVVDRLAEIATGSNATFLTPYPALTPRDRPHAHRVELPAGLPGLDDRRDRAHGAGGAATIVNGFITGFECTGEAPENGVAPC